MGYRFRLHREGLPGRPDIVFPGRHSAIFVHGCFWHGHRCSKGKPPKSHKSYWTPKIAENKKRDRRTLAALRRAGWKSLVIWQCQTRLPDKLRTRISSFLTSAPMGVVGATMRKERA